MTRQRLLQVIVACVLLYGGLMHASNPYLFANAVAAYNILPIASLALVPVILPHLMIVVGGCFIWQRCETVASIVAAMLFAVFAAAQIWAWCSGADIGCGCFGYSSEAISPRTIAIPVLCAAACVTQFRRRHARSGCHADRG